MICLRSVFFKFELEGMCHVEQRLDELVSFVARQLAHEIVAVTNYSCLIFDLMSCSSQFDDSRHHSVLQGRPQNVFQRWSARRWELGQLLGGKYPQPQMHTQIFLAERSVYCGMWPASSRLCEKGSLQIWHFHELSERLWVRISITFFSTLFFKHVWSGPCLPWRKLTNIKSS